MNNKKMNNPLEQVLEALKELPTIAKQVKELGNQMTDLQDQVNGLKEQGKHILTAVADLQAGQQKLQEEVSAIRGQIARNAELPTAVEDLKQKVTTHESTFDSIHDVLDKQRKIV